MKHIVRQRRDGPREFLIVQHDAHRRVVEQVDRELFRERRVRRADQRLPTGVRGLHPERRREVRQSVERLASQCDVRQERSRRSAERQRSL